MVDITFASDSLLGQLSKALIKLTGARAQELARIGDVFGDPKLLARYYIEPYCQQHNPADRHEDLEPIADVRQPAFQLVNGFLKGDHAPLGDGRTQLFVLSDAGMGKTSLLMMIRLMHLTAKWPKGHDCLLLKLGKDTLDQVLAQPNQADTVLLLDALDEDPLAWGRTEGRLIELLDATSHYHRVILSCRTQFFPENGADSFGRPGRVSVGGFTCPMVFLSLFDDDQVDAYLRNRFPDAMGTRLMAQDNPVRLRAAEVVKSMESLRFRPLLLAHIEDVIEAGGRDWNVYTLYEFLVSRWLDREERKLRGQMEHPPDKAKLWEVCTAVATYLQAHGSRLLERRELDALVARVPAVATLDRFDVGGRSLMNRNDAGAFRFAHFSIQEFLVAGTLIQNSDHLEDTPVRVTEELLKFLFCASAMPSLARLDLSGLRRESQINLGFRDKLADGSEGPVLRLIPQGQFSMGSPDTEQDARMSESPRHEVCILRSFYIGLFLVTCDEFYRFCVDTGRPRRSDQGWGCNTRPAINVSWVDAMAYCEWLSRETDKHYRLPSEAEWEYACRARTETRWSFGNDKSVLSEHAWYLGNSDGKTQPVGMKRPNPWGLYDMHGNAKEWLQDPWHRNYEGALNDGSAWEDSLSPERVIRGGGWRDEAEFCRSANRHSWRPALHSNDLGFRLGRETD